MIVLAQFSPTSPLPIIPHTNPHRSQLFLIGPHRSEPFATGRPATSSDMLGSRGTFVFSESRQFFRNDCRSGNHRKTITIKETDEPRKDGVQGKPGKL